MVPESILFSLDICGAAIIETYTNMLRPNHCTKNKLRLLIADDHQMFRAGIINLLKKEADIEIVGEASDGKTAVKLAADLHPDVVLMDIHLPLLDGIGATQKIGEADPSIHVLALTSYEEEEYVINMIRSGAKGYVLKEAPIEELMLAIKTIANGNSYFAKEVLCTISNLLKRADTNTHLKQKAKRHEITGRELEVLQYIAAEYTNKEIASKLFISPRTVETHRRNLIQKLRVKNTAGLVKYYFDNLHPKEPQGGVLVRSSEQ
ncbi:MAG TPA: response regulator transcription factor [Bacteroidetes bacterium]|nr:response regulator transcription factor [Bacteroidota bacterium]